MIPRPGESRRLIAAYSYRNSRGIEQFQHVRYEPKAFGYRYRPDPANRPSVWAARKPLGAEGYLYRLPELLAAKRRRRPGRIWLTEGEKDADSLVAIGEVATTHHGGAGKFTPEQAQHFRGWRGWLVVAADNDPSGARCALLRADLLIGAGIRERRIRIAMAAVGKDVSDHLTAGAGIKDFRGQSVAELRAEIAGLPPAQPWDDGYAPNLYDLGGAQGVDNWAPLTRRGNHHA